jgi:hypothetical protein
MYKGKQIQLRLEKRNYSARVIADISKYSVQNVRYILKGAEVVSTEKGYCSISKQTVNMFKSEHVNSAFKQHVLYVVHKKERKSYFEFAYKEYQSKTNQL